MSEDRIGNAKQLLEDLQRRYAQAERAFYDACKRCRNLYEEEIYRLRERFRDEAGPLRLQIDAITEALVTAESCKAPTLTIPEVSVKPGRDGV